MRVPAASLRRAVVVATSLLTLGGGCADRESKEVAKTEANVGSAPQSSFKNVLEGEVISADSYDGGPVAGAAPAPAAPAPMPGGPGMMGGGMMGGGMLQPRGSGFLGGALQTAAGVAGGVLAGNALMNLFEGGHSGSSASLGDLGSGAGGGGSPWGGGADPSAGFSDNAGWNTDPGQAAPDAGWQDASAAPDTGGSWDAGGGGDFGGGDQGGGGDSWT